eukprot:scaffold130007_cov18-Prasinocladus_malaysianus.AAC.1
MMSWLRSHPEWRLATVLKYIYVIMFWLDASSTATLNICEYLMSRDALRVLLAVDQEIHATAKILFKNTIVQETAISAEQFCF